jgi:lipopolysaccharide transport system permease protein
MLNPMAGIIDGYRSVILKASPPDIKYLALAFVISIALFLVGYVTFKKAEGVFADVI